MKKFIKFDKKFISKFLNYPIFVFIGFLIIAIVMVLGSRFIIGQGSTSTNCHKTGVNMGAEIPRLSGEIRDKAKDLGMKYILGIIHYSQSEIDSLKGNASDKKQPVEELVALKADDIYKNGQMILVVRICDGAHECGFAPPDGQRKNQEAWRQAGFDYGEFLKRTGEKLKNTRAPYIIAHGGHNEPHGDIQSPGTGHPLGVDDIDPNFEAAFIKGIYDSGAQNHPKIKLITPQFDTHHPNTYTSYVNKMRETWNSYGSGDLIRIFDYIAVATHDTEAGPESKTPLQRVKEVYDFFGKDVFVTEIGMLDKEYPELVTNYAAVRDYEHTVAVLVFNAFYQNPSYTYHAVFASNIDALQTVIGRCGKYNIINPNTLKIDGKEALTYCAFEEATLKPCQVRGDLSVSADIRLYYDADAKIWKAEWFKTAQVQSLPAMKYYSSTKYIGEGDIDHINPAGGYNRLSFEGDYDFTKLLPGFGLLLDGGNNIRGRLHYTHGSGVLISSLGIHEDYTQKYKTPNPGFLTESQFEQADIDLDTQHTSGTLWDTVFKPIKWLGDLFNRKCKNSYPIDEFYEGNATSGYESLMEQGTITYSLQDLVAESNIMTQVGQGCEGGSCDIKNDLTGCNPKRIKQTELTPDDPGYDPNIEEPQYKTSFTYANVGTDGKIKNKSELIKCLRGKRIEVKVSTGSEGTFAIGGGGHLLETYLKRLQVLNPKQTPICHNKNIGIEAKVKSSIYERNFDCNQGQTVGSGSCPGNNVSLNPGFEYVQTAYGSDNWFTSAGWYPFQVAGKKPEFGQGGDAARQPSYFQKVFTSGGDLNSGVFTPVVTDRTVPKGTQIKVSGYFQSNVGPHGCRYGNANTNLSVSVGIEYQNSYNKISGSNFKYSPSTTGSFSLSGAEAGNCDTVPEWKYFEVTFTAPSDTNTFTIFVKGTSPDSEGNFGNNNMFLDDVCIVIDGEGTFSNTLGVNTQPTDVPFAEGAGDGSAGGGYCEADTKFQVPKCTYVKDSKSQTSYFPYLGLVEEIPAYLALVQAAKDKEIPDLPSCAKPGDYPICYCEEGQIDPLAEYLAKQGILDAEELKMIGFYDEAIAEGVIPEPEREEEEEVGPDISGWDADAAAEIDETLVDVLADIEKQVEAKATGKCVPKEMLAAILVAETRAQRGDGELLTSNDLADYQYETNNPDCKAVNKACAKAEIPYVDLRSPTRHEMILNARNAMWAKEDCTTSNLEAITDQECKNTRKDMGGIRCCDVRGVAQFEVGTWDYLESPTNQTRIKSISTALLKKYKNYDPANYDFPKRERVIDSLVGAALKLSVPEKDCSRWKSNPEQVVREKAREYNQSDAYNNLVWDQYKAFYAKFHPE